MKRIVILFITIASSVLMYAQSSIKGQKEYEDFRNQLLKTSFKDSTTIYYLKKAVKAGNVKAQFTLGNLYANGNYWPQDLQKGIYWIEKAASQGYNEAIYSIGNMYKTGNGVTKNLRKALEWYMKTAEQGERRGLLNVADVYHEMGDYSNAFIWYSKLDSPYARMKIASYYFKGAGVEKDYTKAFDYFSRSSDIYYSQFYLGLMYDKGYGVEQDFNKAAYWYEKSTKQGYAKAQNNLGYLYHHGLGVPQDKTKAIELYLKAAKADNSSAMINLGSIYESMNDFTNAFLWYSKAADDKNDKWAIYVKGQMYYKGEGTEKDLGKAFDCFSKTPDNVISKLYLAQMYEKGEYVEKNYSKAIEWYEKIGGDIGEYNIKKIKKLIALESNNVEEDYNIEHQSSDQQAISMQPIQQSVIHKPTAGSMGTGGMTGDDIYYYNIMQQATLQSISNNQYPDGCNVTLLPEVEEYMYRTDKTSSVNGQVYIDSFGNPVGGDSGSASSGKTIESNADKSRIKKDAKAVTNAIISAENNPTGAALSKKNNYIHNIEKRNGK